MTLKVISAEKILFEGETSMVSLPGALGRFAVLENHAPLISTLTAGEIIYRSGDGTDVKLDVDGGIVDVNSNNVSVCIY